MTAGATGTWHLPTRGGRYGGGLSALAEARHHLGDIDLSASQLLLFLTQEWLPRRAGAQKSADEEVAPAAHVSHDRPSPTPTPIPQRIIMHRCPLCERAWTEGRADPMGIDPRDRTLAARDAEEIAGDNSAGTPGHLTRKLPPTLGRSVLVREGGRRQVPGCRNRRHMEVHHIIPRCAGGDHAPENFATLCSCPHDKVHKEVMRITRGHGGALSCTRDLGVP